MRVSLCCLFFVLFGISAAQAQPDTVWTSQLNLGRNIAINSGIQLADGGFAVAGSHLDTLGRNRFLVARLSSSGSIIWTKILGDNTNQIAYGITQIPTGNLVAVGSRYQSGSTYSRTILLVGVSLQGDSMWTRAYVSNLVSGNAAGKDIITLADGNLAVIGHGPRPGGNNTDCWFLKVSARGDSIRTKILGGPLADYGTRIRELPDRSFVVGGYTLNATAGFEDFWMLRLDSTGNQICSRTVGTSSSDFCNTIAISDSNVYLAGQTSNTSTGTDGYIATVNISCDRIRDSVYTASRNYYEQILGVVSRSGGGMMCVGAAGSEAENTSPWVLTVNTDGGVDSSWILTSLRLAKFTGIIRAQDGGYFVYGQQIQSGVSVGYFVKWVRPSEIRGVVRESDTRNPLTGVRVEIVGSPLYTYSNLRGEYQLESRAGTVTLALHHPCIVTDTVENIVVQPGAITERDLDVGVSRVVFDETSINLVVHNHRSDSTYLRLKNPGSGNLSFSFTTDYRIPNRDWFAAIPPVGVIPSGDSVSVMIRAYADTSETGNFEFFGYLFLRTNTCPDSVHRIPVSATILDAPSASVAAAQTFALSPAFPNPFNPSTVLSFQLPAPGFARLTVFDVMGRKIGVLMEGKMEAGSHQTIFDGRNLATGIYWARLESGNQVATQKMLLMK